jgi:hypothetical protein
MADCERQDSLRLPGCEEALFASSLLQVKPFYNHPQRAKRFNRFAFLKAQPISVVIPHSENPDLLRALSPRQSIAWQGNLRHLEAGGS